MTTRQKLIRIRDISDPSDVKMSDNGSDSKMLRRIYEKVSDYIRSTRNIYTKE